MLVLLPSTCSFLALSFRLSQYSCLYQQLAVVPIRSKTSSVYSTLIQFREVLHTGRVGTTNDKIRGKNRVWNQKQVEEEIPHQTTSSHTDLQIMGFTRTEETNIHSEAATVVFSTEIEEPILTTRAKRSRKSNQSTERTETAKRQTRKGKVPVEESNEGDTKVIIPPKKKQQRKVEATDKVMEDPLPTSTKRRNNNNNNNKVEQCITECDLLPKLWNPNSHTNQFKIISWNVNGIRAVLKKYPDALSDLANRHNPDLICIQETKLQESHVEDPKLKLKGFLLEQEGYDSYWSCSKTTLGYSGTAIFIKRNPTSNREATTITSIVTSDSGTQKKQQSKLQSFFKSKKVEDLENSTTTTSPPNTSKLDTNDTIYMPQNISFGMGSDGNDPEGRCIVIDYPMFSIINTYVPNAGDGLKRLEYRIQQWDVKLRNEMKKIEETRGVPVILVGDLNVGKVFWYISCRIFFCVICVCVGMTLIIYSHS